MGTYSELIEKQNKFARMVPLLIQFAQMKGYYVTLGDVWAKAIDKRHRKGSFHFKRLAIDLNLFKNGKYLRSTKAHEFLGIFWESIGGTWGGRFKKPDGNHYSYGE